MQTDFLRFIHQHRGQYRMIDRTDLSTLQHRSKRWTPSNDPLDESYYQRFLSYDEQENWHRLLQTSPTTKNHIRLQKIGQSYENRSLTVLQISNRPRDKRRGRRLAVFIDGGMHAREWLSIGVVNYLLIHFLRLRTSEPKIRTIFRHFDLFFLPLMNPDGYEYSRQTDRLWRKNRAPTTHSDFWNGDPSCYGVDLNRNFPFRWDTAFGSSIHACSHSYRGPNPSSEDEVQSLVKFFQRSPYKFYAYFNLHAYGRFWLLPWTYTRTEKVPNFDQLLQRSLRTAAIVMNGTYKVGQASFLLYPCSGTSLDFTSTFMPHAITFELSPVFQFLPMCYERNKTADPTCTIGFLTGPEAIAIDGQEIFQAIVEYLYSIIEDRFLK